MMAPIGGTNTIRFRAPLSSDNSLKLTCDTATFSPSSLQEKDIQVQIAGTGTTSQDSSVTLKLGETNSVSVPLRVKTMKKRTVKVALHRVHGLDKNGTETTPLYFPTKEQLENYLHRVFGRQTNTFFAVTNFEENGTGIDFDSEDDGKLFYNTPDFAIATPNAKANPEGGFHIDVWVTGGISIFVYNQDFPQQIYGYAPTSSRCIIDGSMTSLWTPEGKEMEFLMHTIAHEIGHILTQHVAHPDSPKAITTNIVGYENKGVDPNIEKRLMCSGDISIGKEEFGTCLIKKEWDLIDGWLQEKVDDPQNP